jgi:hypothetical protein
VTEQNWVAVALDLAIVVLGVFIGIQVSNWNDERIRIDETAAARARLIADLQGDRDALAVRKAFYGEVFDAALQTDERLQAELPADYQGQWQFVYDAWRAGGEWTFGPSGQVYRELQSAGKLNFIVEPAVVRQLRDYYEDGARELEAQTPFRSAYYVQATGLLAARALMHMARCFAQTEFEPSQPADEDYFRDCPPPDAPSLITDSASRLMRSGELRVVLNTRIADLLNLQLLADYLDDRAKSLIAQLEVASY